MDLWFTIQTLQTISVFVPLIAVWPQSFITWYARSHCPQSRQHRLTIDDLSVYPYISSGTSPSHPRPSPYRYVKFSAFLDPAFKNENVWDPIVKYVRGIDLNANPGSVQITGHSLGGALSNIVGSKTGCVSDAVICPLLRLLLLAQTLSI
jgi:hypothetical protein